MNKVKILIVEDQQSLRELFAQYVAEWGYSPILAEDGNQAWEMLLAEQQVEAILLDRIMPNMDGLSFLKKIKQSSFKSIPIIMVTSENNKTDVIEGINAGAFYYLGKPVEPDLLKAVIKSALLEFSTTDFLKHEVKVYKKCTELLLSCQYGFQTPGELNKITPILAHACPNPEEVSLALNELMLNAIEHGNLGISYKEKSE